MKRVLMVAYPFPPLRGGGIYRTIKFAKYLPQFGWEPHIITCQFRNALEKDVRPQELPEAVKVHRAFAPHHIIPPCFKKISRFFLRPDSAILWKPFVIRLSMDLARTRSFSVIYTTSNPNSTNLIGLQLKKRMGLPLVVDFRDPWTQFFLKEYPSKFYYDLDLRWESKVVEKADVIIHNTDTLKENFVKLHGPQAADKSIVIPNGYDPEDFKGLFPKQRSAEEFTIAYIGSVYSGLDALFKGLSRVSNMCPDIGIKLEFIGQNNPEKIMDLAKASGVGSMVKVLPPVSHSEAVKKMVDSDALLHYLPDVKGIEGVPGQKIYEYMASGTPIIGVFPKGAEVQKLVSVSERNVSAEQNNTEEIAQAIIQAYENWKRYGNKKKPVMMDEYNRRLLTKRLATVFDELSS